MIIKEYTTYREDEILKLYASVGWVAYTKDPETLKNGFGHSLLVLAAYENEQLLGIVRTVGDGYTVVFIQDILVLPAHQRKGVGSALIKAVLERFPHVRQIELVTDDTERTVAFYRSMGFSPLSEIGCRGFIKC